MICTDTDSYVTALPTIKKGKNGSFWNREHENMQIVHGLYELIFLTSKMIAKRGKQNVH